ncbi:hypothetical protein OAD26_00240 [bacterium]|nr:hypothetical protein [bacterium]
MTRQVAGVVFKLVELTFVNLYHVPKQTMWRISKMTTLTALNALVLAGKKDKPHVSMSLYEKLLGLSPEEAKAELMVLSSVNNTTSNIPEDSEQIRMRRIMQENQRENEYIAALRGNPGLATYCIRRNSNQ